MAVKDVVRFPLGDSDPAAVLKALGSIVPFGATRSTNQELTLLDSFDGRLFRDGGLLTAEPTPGGARLRWLRLDLRRERGRCEVETLPRLAWDLPPGRLRKDLEHRLGLRALLPIVRVHSEVESSVVRGEEGEWLSRFEIVRMRVRSARSSRGKSVEPQLFLHRGALAKKDWKRMLRELARRELSAAESETWAEVVCRAAGHEPGVHPGRSKPRLDPRAPALDGHRLVFRSLVGDLEANEPGAKADLDSEFLHDYRVALRRLRACLSFSRAWIDSDRHATLRDELRWLGHLTGETRDLDVHLLALPQLGKKLAREERAALLRHHRCAALKQRRAQAHMAGALESGRYHSLKQQLRGACDATEHVPTPPLSQAIREYLDHEHRRVCKTGRRAGPEATAEQLHRLRRRVKRLRAVLDVFPGVLSAKEVATLRKPIRRLLSRLGALQDLHVHMQIVRAIAEELAATDPSAVLALGMLLESLRQEEGRALEDAREAFERFDRPTIRKAFRRATSDGL